MSNVLYVTAHPLNTDTYSLSVGNQFIKTYKKFNPKDVISHLDLYHTDLPQIDADILGHWGQPPYGDAFDKLREETKKDVIRMHELIQQFKDSDKIVIVNPVWNYSFPSVLKAYIDIIINIGETVKRADNGLRGLAGLTGTQQGKKVMHIQASGTVLSHGKFNHVEYSHSYLKAVMNLMGVEDVEAIFVEGMSEKPDQVQHIKAEAIQKAILKAEVF